MALREGIMEDLDWRWFKELSTGITFLDREHRELLRSYGNLVRQVHDGADAKRFRECFQALKEQMTAHFAHEERVMRNIVYPDFHGHKIAHDKALADFDDFILNIGTVFADDDLKALAKHFKYWFRRHIEVHDVVLLRYIDRYEEALKPMAGSGTQ
jgi:hemerythrin-like metal-binding protein